MKKNWYQKAKDSAKNAPKWPKCAYPTCNNEITTVSSKYCGKQDCPKRIVAKFGKENLKLIKNE